MQNPWKLTTFILAGALLVSSARAETNWKTDALGHLDAAAKILAEHGGSTTGKTPPTKEPEKKGADASPTTKALQLTRAAIVQLRRAE